MHFNAVSKAGKAPFCCRLKEEPGCEDNRELADDRAAIYKNHVVYQMKSDE